MHFWSWSGWPCLLLLPLCSHLPDWLCWDLIPLTSITVLALTHTLPRYNVILWPNVMICLWHSNGMIEVDSVPQQASIHVEKVRSAALEPLRAYGGYWLPKLWCVALPQNNHCKITHQNSDLFPSKNCQFYNLPLIKVQRLYLKIQHFLQNWAKWMVSYPTLS